MASRRPARRDPGARVGGLVSRGRSVPRWVGRPARPAPRHVPTTPRIVRDRRRDATIDKAGSATGCGGGLRIPRPHVRRRSGRHRTAARLHRRWGWCRPDPGVHRRSHRYRPEPGVHRRAPRPRRRDLAPGRAVPVPGSLRTRVAGMTRRTGHLRGCRGRSRGAIGGPVRGPCRPRRRRGPLPRPPLLSCRHTRRIGPEPARRRRGGRPPGPWLTTGGRRRPVRGRSPLGRVPSARGRRPILPRPLVNRRRLVRRPIGRGLGPVPWRPLLGRCPRTILASRLLLGRDRGPVLTRRPALHTPNLTGGRRPILRSPILTGGWSSSLNPPRRLCWRRLALRGPRSGSGCRLLLDAPSRFRGRGPVLHRLGIGGA